MSPRTLRKAIRHNFIKLGTVALIAAASVSASPVGIYGGIDNGAGPGGPFPNSIAAEATLWAALGVSSPTITFEGVANLASLGGGVSASLLNVDPMSSIQHTDEHAFCGTPCIMTEPLGFNVTPGAGSTDWLRIVPNFNSAAGASVTFNFSSGINAFGLWFTDSQADLPGPITVSFNDGTFETLSVTKNGLDLSGNSTGGTSYFGFVTDSPFTSVTINTGATNTKRDALGIDDITFGTTGSIIVDSPEPSTMGLFAGILLILAVRLKTRNTRLASRPR